MCAMSTTPCETNRPYRDAWEAEKILPYLEGRAGMEFDPEVVTPFVAMMRKWEPRVAVLNDEQALVVAAGVPQNGGSTSS